MKKYSTFIMVGIIVVLAAALTGTLIFMTNQPPQQRGFTPLTEIAAMEPDASKWGLNFPNQYSSFLKTADNTIATTFGGSDMFSHLERDPRQKILFTGMPFSKDYNEERGHEWALYDVNNTERLNLDRDNPKNTRGTCYSCKTGNMVEQWDKLGLEGVGKTFFSDMTPEITESISCINCHEPNTMRLVVTNPALEEAFERQGKDWNTFTRQEMRTVVCANCHVEYYFDGPDRYLTFPWDKGTTAEEMWVYYTEEGFSDWTYPETETPMLKVQHPEYELFLANSTHYNAGVSCADCHMPYVRDGAAKYSLHDIHSPLFNPTLACGQCHTDTDYVIGRVNEIQNQVYNTKIATEDAIIDAVNAIKAATANPASDATLLNEARQLHRQSQFYWDYISAENSMGFHNPEYALKLLADATNLARQAQMKAAQAANDPSLLEINTYYKSQGSR